jgi:hypothetical protein
MLLVVREQSGTESVVHAEAEKDAADFLFSLLNLPISKVIDMLIRHPMVGCLGNLYGSVQTLPDNYICHHDTRAARDALLAGRLHGGFVTNRVYTVSDNLRITRQSTTADGIAMMNAGGPLRKKIVTLDDNEVFIHAMGS